MASERDEQLMSRLTALMLATVAAATVTVTIWRVSLAVRYWSQLGQAHGVWLTLADDMAHGTFYRPIVGEMGYGGTRYFPLHFVLHAGLLKAGLPLVGAGYVITGFSALALAAGGWFLLTRLGLRGGAAIGITLLAFSTVAAQIAVTSIRGDLLPAALNVWGLAFVAAMMAERTEHGRMRAIFWAAAICFSLAFSAKVTTVFGLAAAVVALAAGHRWRDALRLTLAAGGMMAVISLLIILFSQGRALEQFRLCGMGERYSAAQLPGQFYRVAAGNDPIGLVFIAMACGGWIAARWSNRLSLLGIALPITFLVTLGIFMSVGTDENHLLDLNVIAVLFLAAAVWREKWFAPTIGIMAVTGLIALGEVAVRLRHGERTPTRQQCRAVYQHAGDRDAGPVLSEFALIPLANGDSVQMLDPFATRIIGLAEPSVAERLHRDLDECRYRAVLLCLNPESSRGREMYETLRFGPGFADHLLASYEAAGKKEGYWLFLPRNGMRSNGSAVTRAAAAK